MNWRNRRNQDWNFMPPPMYGPMPYQYLDPRDVEDQVQGWERLKKHLAPEHKKEEKKPHDWGKTLKIYVALVTMFPILALGYTAVVLYLLKLLGK